MREKQLAWGVCSTSTVTKNFYVRRFPRLKTAATFFKAIRDLGNHCSNTRRSYPPRHHCDIATNRPVSQSYASPSEERLWLPTESHTYKLGRLLGRDCRPGDVILLFGDLGVGKTVLARGYIHSAHSDDRIAVTSPTYLLLNSYPPPKQHSGIPEILHMDLWRLKDASQRPIADLKKAFDQNACLIEWPDRLKSITPRIRLEVHMTYINEDFGLASTEDDPWGFGSDDPYASQEQRGRYVSLKPHGKQWNERIEAIIREFGCMDASNGVTLNK